MIRSSACARDDAADIFASREVCRGLAPCGLPNFRSQRYDGDSLQTDLADYPASDRTALTALYARLVDLYLLLTPLAMDPLLDPATLEGPLAAQRIDGLQDIARRIGDQPSPYAPAPRRAIHDIRGGALLALTLTHEMMLIDGRTDRETLLCLFRYARDHLKIMRNCIPAIDPQRSARDRAGNAHSIDLLREKWLNVDLNQASGREVRVRMDCDWQGTICDSCMEMSALDRIVYNLVGNATKYGDGHWIQLRVFPVDARDADARVETLRFVIANPISEAQQRALHESVGAETGRVFEAGRTTAGSGYGLAIISEFVTEAFGLMETSEALEGAYIGARIIDGHFFTWFHWPTVV